MTAADVVAFLALMDASAVRVWLDGGWAVDALLGRQTRRHDDLDIVIEALDLSRAEEALRGADTSTSREMTRGHGPSCSVTPPVI